MKDMHIYNLPYIDDIEKKHKALMIKTFAKNIRDIRLSKKLTQEEVAAGAGISAKYLGEVERREKMPTAVVVFKISKALGVPICRILPASRCPRINGDMEKEINELFAGKEERDIQKAIKILEVFFE